MRIKSYFADSVQEAIDKARLELGLDAMLISSRQTDRELRDLGAYEVVLGLPETDTPAPGAASVTSIRSAELPSASSEVVLRELAELRQQVESFRQSVARSNMARGNKALAPELGNTFDRLTSAGFSEDLAQELTEAVAIRTRSHTDKSHRMIREHRDLFARDLLHALLEEEIRNRFEVSPFLGDAGQNTTAVMFVGPPAAGKTTSLVKLGLNYGLKKGRPLHLVSADNWRIGAWDQLNAYARISGVDFKAVQDFSSLGSTLGGKGITLIDTPGFSKFEEREAEALIRFTRELPIEVQLVLPAHLSVAVAQQMWKRFSRFNPSKLLVTHTDEVAGSAPVIELGIRCGLPLSFLATGQQVPEDIEEASTSKLMESLLPRERAVSIAA